VIQEGQPFPDFTLADQNGEVMSKSNLEGSEAVIYFYPKDDTPGCTTEACEFQSAVSDLHKAGKTGFRVIGVSPDAVKSHKKFADKYKLEFTLLADVDHTLAEALGVWVEKSMYGKKYMGVERTTFLVDRSGLIKKIFNKVKPEGHASQIFDSVG
jgi:peroxiredoxin Q/BCP